MERQIVLTVDPENGKLIRVEKVDGEKRIPAYEVEPAELSNVSLKHVGVIFHRRKNPDCFYFHYLGSLWEVCF
jgi:hypothetical protein